MRSLKIVATATAAMLSIFSANTAFAATPVSGWVDFSVSLSDGQIGDFTSSFIALPEPIVLPDTLNGFGSIQLDDGQSVISADGFGKAEWISSTAGSFTIAANMDLPTFGIGEVNALTRYRFLATGNGILDVAYSFSETGLTMIPGFTLSGNDGTFLTTDFSQDGGAFSLTIVDGVDYDIFTSISLRDSGNVDLALDWAITYDTPVGGAVPEPATWAMLILGFGLVGASARRRRAAIA